MITFTALPTDQVRTLQSGGPDAYGAVPERAISDGGGNPCRHCLRDIPKGEEMLVLAYRPFQGTHPYAETGPLFLCSEACENGSDAKVPEILTTSPDYLIKGYGADDRIVYGTGKIVTAQMLALEAELILEKDAISYVHVRSARNNCYQLRIDRV